MLLQPVKYFYNGIKIKGTWYRVLQLLKNFVVDGSKKGRPKKRWKEVVEKNMLITGLKRTDAQKRSLWRLGCKNRFTPARRKNKPDSKKMKIFIIYFWNKKKTALQLPVKHL